MIISKNPIKNKAASRFNHAKLNFLLDIIQSKNENPPEETSSKELLQFPTNLLLEFIEKMTPKPQNPKTPSRGIVIAKIHELKIIGKEENEYTQ
jgi:hypothetical protein